MHGHNSPTESLKLGSDLTLGLKRWKYLKDKDVPESLGKQKVEGIKVHFPFYLCLDFSAFWSEMFLLKSVFWGEGERRLSFKLTLCRMVEGARLPSARLSPIYYKSSYSLQLFWVLQALKVMSVNGAKERAKYVCALKKSGKTRKPPTYPYNVDSHVARCQSGYVFGEIVIMKGFGIHGLC